MRVLPGRRARPAPHGSAETYGKARAAFKFAWRHLLPQITHESFEEYKRHLAMERWKHRMWKDGFKMPTQLASGRSECFCGAGIDIKTTERHVFTKHMDWEK